jgi:tRNA pseudouridine38-40 synthase
MGRARYVIKFAFEGQQFTGYARQPEGGTVEDELIDALRNAELVGDRKEAFFTSASRVDKGVSALSAAAAFDTDAPRERVLRSVNANAMSLVAHSIATVEPGFDPRRAATYRWYRYHYGPEDPGRDLDVPTMRRAAEAFLGEHDMSPFARVDGRDPMRTVLDVGVERTSGALVLDVVGRSFLWNQVRRMASAIRSAGLGETSVGAIERALQEGGDAPYATLPSVGLFLMDVAFDGLEFERATDLPSGTVERLRERYHQDRCSVRFHEYLRDNLRI